MDKDILVKEGQALIQILDQGMIKPRGAMWVYSSDNDSWKLWIVPADNKTDKATFYRMVSEAISRNRNIIPTLDVGMIELKTADHPAVAGVGQFLKMEGLGAATFTNNRFNGFFLPDGVVLRMAI